MKKFIFAVLMMFVVIPISVNAEECTDEMVASYLPQANNVYMNYVVTSNPDTYKIYVYGLSTGLSYDGINGTRYNDGYYAYATAGDTFTISVKISDGSICALSTIKTVSISVPTNTTVNQPVVEPTTPSTDTNTTNSSTTTNNTITSPSTNTNSGSSSTNETTSSNTNSSSGQQADVSTSDDTSDEDTSIDSGDVDGDEIVENKEVFSTPKISKHSNSIIKYIIISVMGIFIIGTGILIYFKKFKGAKK
ncbi:MAG: hypothetical protein ACK5HP_01565 [Bacilli bacterium]